MALSPPPGNEWSWVPTDWLEAPAPELVVPPLDAPPPGAIEAPPVDPAAAAELELRGRGGATRTGGHGSQHVSQLAGGAPTVDAEVAQSPSSAPTPPGVELATPPVPASSPALLQVPDLNPSGPELGTPEAGTFATAAPAQVSDLVGSVTMDAPPKPDEELTPEELGQKYANLDPEAYARVKELDAQKRNEHMLTRQVEELRADRERQEKNFQIEQTAREQSAKDRAEIRAASQKLADTPIDNDHWMESRSTLQKIAAFAAAIVGGMNTSNTGGKNVGLEAIDRAIEQDIATQKSNLENKRAELSRREGLSREDYEAAIDDFKAAEAKRQALWENAARGLEVEMQQYDPRGRTALNIADSVREIRARQAKSAADAEQQIFKNRVEAGKLAVDVDKQQLDWQKRADALAKEARSLGAGGPKQSEDFWEAYSGKRPPMAMTKKEFADWLATAGKVKALNKPDSEKSEAQKRKEEADAVEAEAKAEAAETGFAFKNPETGELFKNPDGKPIVEMDATKRNRTSGIIEAATNIRRLADRMVALKKKYGGAVKTLHTDEAQEIASLAGMVKFETFKAFDLGAPSAGDQVLAEQVSGGADPTSFINDASVGFQKYADNVEQKANTALRNSGYKGPTLRFHREADAPNAKKTVVDELGEKLGGALYSKAADLTGDPAKDVGAKVGHAAQQVFQPQDTKQIDEWFQQMSAYAEQPGDQGDLARKYLGELSTRAVSPDARARAKTILDGLPGAHPRTDEGR